jgi:hypothetical protein
MSTISETELREITEWISRDLKDLINSRFDKVEERLNRVEGVWLEKLSFSANLLSCLTL